MVRFFAMMGFWSLVFFFACIALALWLVHFVIPMSRFIRIAIDVIVAGGIVWWSLHLFAGAAALG